MSATLPIQSFSFLLFTQLCLLQILVWVFVGLWVDTSDGFQGGGQLWFRQKDSFKKKKLTTRKHATCAFNRNIFSGCGDNGYAIRFVRWTCCLSKGCACEWKFISGCVWAICYRVCGRVRVCRCVSVSVPGLWTVCLRVCVKNKISVWFQWARHL